jgi:hypothetical protein
VFDLLAAEDEVGDEPSRLEEAVEEEEEEEEEDPFVAAGATASSPANVARTLACVAASESAFTGDARRRRERPLDSPTDVRSSFDEGGER